VLGHFTLDISKHLLNDALWADDVSLSVSKSAKNRNIQLSAVRICYCSILLLYRIIYVEQQQEPVQVSA
jgi:hypothetical protein